VRGPDRGRAPQAGSPRPRGHGRRGDRRRPGRRYRRWRRGSWHRDRADWNRDRARASVLARLLRVRLREPRVGALRAALHAAIEAEAAKVNGEVLATLAPHAAAIERLDDTILAAENQTLSGAALMLAIEAALEG